MRQDNAQARERFTSSPATRLDPRLPLVKDAEDTVEVRRFDQAVPAVRVQCAAPPARVAVRVLIRLMMAHLNPKALQHVVEPEIELRLDALAERIAQGELRHLRHTAVQPLNLCHRAHGASPFRHGIVSSTRPLPIRTNITRQGEAPEGRAPQHEAESAPGWTGQQRRSTRNRRGVTTVPASVSLGQVMMPTNPEMLQRSAERASQYKAVQHVLDDRNIPNKGL